MLEDIHKDEEKLEATKVEAQEIRMQIYTVIAKQEKKDGAPDLQKVQEDSSRITRKQARGSITNSIEFSGEAISTSTATEEILVEVYPRGENERQCNNQTL